MKDKFAEYYSNSDRISELSEYVHQNFKLIQTKMISEMRRKLDITPDLTNPDGYASLMASLHGRMFNEMVYATAGVLQCLNLNLTQLLPPLTLSMILDMMMGINPLGGKLRNDIPNDLEGFKVYYQKNIDELRKVVEALPK